MPVINYRLPEINFRLKDFVPGLFGFSMFALGFIKVLAFLGITTSWNNDWTFFLLIQKFEVPNFIAVSFTLALFSIALLFKGRGRLWAPFILNLILTSLLIMDLMYFRGYGNFLNVYLLKQTSNLENLWSSIISMLRITDVFFILDLVFGFIFLVKFKSIGKNVSRKIPLFFLCAILSIGYISYAHYRYDVIEKGQNNIIFRICWTPTDTMRNLSPVGYHVYDTYIYFKENRSIKLSIDQQNEIRSWYAAKQENGTDNEFKGIFSGKNLILIQVESLENFVLNQKYNNQEITPTLNRLLKNSIYFPNFYEQVWNGTTSDAELLTNTSVYPVRRGSTFFRFPQNQYNSLPVLLEGKGYTTQAIHPDKGSYWNWEQALTSIGFDHTLDASAFKQEEQIGLGLSDGSFLRQVVPILKETKQPFYNFMITLTSHGPFDIPEEYRNLDMDSEINQTKFGGYFQSLNYTDQQIGLFLENLEREGLLDNTVVVIYGDHGGIHKYYSDELETIQPQEEWWKEYDKKIPFIIYQKGLESKVVETTGGQIDILPTLSYLMGIDDEKYAQTAQGRNLMTTHWDFAVLADRSLVGKDANDPELSSHGAQGIDIADLIIQSNFFADGLMKEK